MARTGRLPLDAVALQTAKLACTTRLRTRREHQSRLQDENPSPKNTASHRQTRPIANTWLPPAGRASSNGSGVSSGLSVPASTVIIRSIIIGNTRKR